MRACLFVLLLAGCATVVREANPIDYDTAPPADWPQLEERLTYADLDTVRRWCNRPKSALSACATPSFRYGLCMIYLSRNDPVLLKHERAHCAGYGHVGSASEPRVMWERWKADQKGELLFTQ